MKFEELGLIEPILKAIEERNYTEPSPIQEKAIPIINEGKDVIGGSATGSGKTLAFGASIIQKTIPGAGIQALVLAPTRELAEQVAGEIILFSKYKPIKVTTVYGGVSINPQIDNLQDTDVVVGTPGRILDHMSRRTIDLTRVRTLVLDEADIMLEMGFIEDVERIIKATPSHRQTLLFSATIRSEIQRLAGRYMRDPVTISGVAMVDPTLLTQQFYNVQDNQKFSLLAHLLSQESEGPIMVFTNTRTTTEYITNNLIKSGFDAIGIHGGLTQARRQQILDSFHSKKVAILVCTDVAARGLDITGVTHVYNYDTVKDPKQYIHRIGRTARAGNEGKAVTILSPRDHDNFRKVLYECQVKVQKMETPDFKVVAMPSMRGPGARSRYDERGPPGRRPGNSSGGPGGRSGYSSRGPGGRPGHSSKGPRSGYSSRGPGGRLESRPRREEGPGRTGVRRSVSGKESGPQVGRR